MQLGHVAPRRWKARFWTRGLLTRRVCELLLDSADAADESTVSLDDIETVLLKKAVQRTQGNLSAAARVLGITRAQIVYRLKARGIAHDDE